MFTSLYINYVDIINPNMLNFKLQNKNIWTKQIFCARFNVEVDKMYYALVSFDSVPKIGFAHHFYAENYMNIRQRVENSLEIVYIKEGALEITLEEETMTAPEGSVFILLRTLPLSLRVAGSTNHSHCTVQLISDFKFDIAKSREEIPSDFSGLILPFVTKQGKTSEKIKKQLYSVVSDLSVSREENEFSSSVRCVGMLEEVHTLFKSEYIDTMHASSILCYKIKKYVSEHICENINLSDISDYLGKTSIYLNSVFKKETGTTIGQYINTEKIRLVSELMINRSMPFKTACESTGITDVSYGYRLFKNKMGITPAKYRSSQKFLK